MKHEKQTRSTGSFNICLAVTATLAGLLAPSAARAEERAPEARKLDFHAVMLRRDGGAEEQALETMTRSLREEVRDGRTQIVVMVHGFGTDQEFATSDYQSIAGRLRSEAKAAGVQVAPVGIYWDSHAGSMGKWLPKAVGHRVTSLLGLRKAVKNPYLEKAKLARQTGRTGLRSVFFRLRDEFPDAPVHVFAHSLGAEVVVSALAPETAELEKTATACEQPQRPLQLGVVTLAGADLDYDLFAKKGKKQVCAALDRAQVWWITVPEKGKADGVLEFRLGAGRGEAVGNKGLKLDRPELDGLLSRRGLVVDRGNVPVRHAFPDYYGEGRLKTLASSMLYLQQPDAPAARDSVLAKLDGILAAEQSALASFTSGPETCEKLYARWRLDPANREVASVKVAGYRTSARAEQGAAGP